MIHVMLAGPPRLVRGALVALLAREDDIEVLPQTDLRTDEPGSVQLSPPDVTVIDIDHIADEELLAAYEYRRRRNACRILLLTGTPPERSRRTALLRPHGLVDKNGNPRLLVEAIRRVTAGHRFVDHDLALTMLDAVDNPLTRREVDILRLAAEGSPVTEIAAQLFLSVGTVRNYVSAIIRKTGARNRIEAIRMARESGWL